MNLSITGNSRSLQILSKKSHITQESVKYHRRKFIENYGLRQTQIFQVNRSHPPEGTRKIAILRARSSSRFALRPSQHFHLVALRAQTYSAFPARSASRSNLVNVSSSQRFALRPSQRFQLAARRPSHRYTWGGTSINLSKSQNRLF